MTSDGMCRGLDIAYWCLCHLQLGTAELNPEIYIVSDVPHCRRDVAV